MGSPYVSQASSGYNATPPADDGSAVASNQVKYATIKTKLGDPVKTYADNINAANVSAFGKIPGGASISTQSTNYQVLSSDQGKLINATSAITITTPDATSVGAPFRFEVLNTSGSAVSIDGSGSQTIDGSAGITLASGAGVSLNTDGSNWFTNGTQGILAASQLQYGAIINGAITEANGSNAVTYSIKSNQTGSDPSTADPVILCLRSSTLGTGFFTYRTITSALSLTISSGSTLGTVSGVPCKIWLVLFDDAGTIRLGAINCITASAATAVTGIFPLGKTPRASSTAEGGAGGADSAATFYTGTAVTNKAYTILVYCAYESGLATAGSWNVSPDAIQLYGLGIPLPGHVIAQALTSSTAVATGTTVVPFDDTIPTSSEGDEYLSKAITPTSKANLLRVEYQLNVAHSADAKIAASVFSSTAASPTAALDTVCSGAGGADVATAIRQEYLMVAGSTSATTISIRAGSSSAGTTSLNGSGGVRRFGGVFASWLKIEEIAA